MKHYYFDFRDGDALITDEVGLDLPGIEAAQVEAACSLADFAKDAVRGRAEHAQGRRMAIEVRDENCPVLLAKFTFEVEPLKH